MNERILNLIQSPELITESDIKLLSEEINSKPYMQSLRALHLMAISRFSPELYQKELTRTAAYTTDKKILYQFINGKLPAVSHQKNNVNESARTEDFSAKEIVETAEATEQPASHVEEEMVEAKNDGSSEDKEHNKISANEIKSEQGQEVTDQEIVETAVATEQPVSHAEEQLQETKKDIQSEIDNNGKIVSAEDTEIALKSESGEKISAQDIVETAAQKQEPASDTEEKLLENEKDISSEIFEARKDFSTNQKIESNTDSVRQQEMPSEGIKPTEMKPDADETKFLVEGRIGREEVQPTAVIVEGEPNRILFQGEENFMNETAPAKIDIEMTKEAGKLVTEKPVQSAEQPTADDIEVLENVEKKEEVLKEAEKTVTGSTGEFETAQKSEIERIAEEGEAVNLVRDGAKQQQTPASEEIPEVTEEKELLAEKDVQENIVTESKQKPEKVSTENPEPESDSQVSYGDVGAFMPEVQVRPSKSAQDITEQQEPRTAQPELSRHELEMKKLIEEVERKIQEKKAKKTETVAEKDPPHNGEVNFQENHDADEKPVEKTVKENQAEKVRETASKAETDSVEEKVSEQVEKEPEATHTQKKNSGWKPMSIPQQKPDALLTEKSSQPAETVSNEAKISEQKTDAVSEKEPSNNPETPVKHEDQVDDLPQNQNQEPEADVPADANEEVIAEPVAKENEVVQEKPSNIPKFITTWQSWLKIDRNTVQFSETATDPEIHTEQQLTVEQTEPEVSAVKDQAIEKFIENEPKISQLKDESTFVVREKKGDISHLMTETLAGIYAEQKLYAKAIRGYQILIEKYPEKKEYFEQKIAEVKELRSGNQFGGNA